MTVALGIVQAVLMLIVSIYVAKSLRLQKDVFLKQQALDAKLDSTQAYQKAISNEIAQVQEWQRQSAAKVAEMQETLEDLKVQREERERRLGL